MEPAKCCNHSCKESSPGGLLLCSGCKRVNYCSKNCQKECWKAHKAYCKHVSSNGTSSASCEPLAYYQSIATQDPRVQSLASELGLDLPAPDSRFGGLQMPMRRLVVTGKDTPENLSLFFGPNAASIEDIHQSTRIEALLEPPRGSPMYAHLTGMNLDKNCPPWTLRGPSPVETQKVKEVKDMQEIIRRHMGSRGVKDVSSNDMRDILVANFGDGWVEVLDTYTQALNSMDQGVHV